MIKVIIFLSVMLGVASAQVFGRISNLFGAGRPIAAPLAGGVGVAPNLNIPIVPNVVGYPLYNFAYTVADPVTGDQRRHIESRNLDRMQGSYSVINPNGNIRTVLYQSDRLRGFQARVAYRPSPNIIRNNFDGGFINNGFGDGLGNVAASNNNAALASSQRGNREK